MNECIFCAIVDGTAPSVTVYETGEVMAFLDIRPIARGHVLVVPKVHSSDLNSMDSGLGREVFAAGHLIARGLRRSDLRADGANLALNDGKAAFQTVFHTHLHVVPRWSGDKLRFVAGFVTRRPRKPEETAALIRAGLENLGIEDAEASGENS